MRGGGGAGWQIELAENTADVAMNRVLADEEPFGDLAIGEALGKATEHLALSRRDLTNARYLPACVRCGIHPAARQALLRVDTEPTQTLQSGARFLGSLCGPPQRPQAL